MDENSSREFPFLSRIQHPTKKMGSRLAWAVAAAALAAPCAAWMTAPSPHALRIDAQREGGVAAARACAASPGSGAVARREALAAGFAASLLTLLPSEARADMTLNSFKRAYFRWVPRIEAGRDFFVLELGAQIEGEEWDKVPTCSVLLRWASRA